MCFLKLQRIELSQPPYLGEVECNVVGTARYADLSISETADLL